MFDKNNKDDKEKNKIINLMKRHNNARIFQMDLDHRHYKIMFYVYDKLLGWNCWTAEERNYIIGLKNMTIKKKNKII